MGCLYTPDNIKYVSQWPWFAKWIVNHSEREEVLSPELIVGGLLS